MKIQQFWVAFRALPKQVVSGDFSLSLRPERYILKQIQTGRKLDEVDVNQINFIIKGRPSRFVAAANEDWRRPERSIPLFVKGLRCTANGRFELWQLSPMKYGVLGHAFIEKPLILRLKQHVEAAAPGPTSDLCDGPIRPRKQD
ncbi:MAG: hypothetical protein WCC90_07570 [Methylocella sp.]